MFWRTDFGFATYVVSRNLCAAGSGLQQTAEHADGRGLARAIRSEKTKHFAFADIEIDVIHGHKVTELLDQVLDHDRIRCPQAWNAAPLLTASTKRSSIVGVTC